MDENAFLALIRERRAHILTSEEVPTIGTDISGDCGADFRVNSLVPMPSTDFGLVLPTLAWIRLVRSADAATATD